MTKCELYTSLNKALKEPQKVYRLSLSDKQLKNFPLEILTLTNLRYLDLSRNQFSTIPGNMSKLKHLEVLNLCLAGDLQSLPKEIGMLTNLQKIDLSYTQVSSLPGSFFSLVNLKEFAATNLTALSPNISKLKNLEKVVIGNLEYQAIPQQLFDLDIKEITFSGDKLNKLPKGIIKLKNLESLEICHTKVTELPAEISDLKKLRKFSLLQPEFDTSDFIDSDIFEIFGLDDYKNEVLELYKEGMPDKVKIDQAQLFGTLAKCTNLQELTLRNNNLPQLLPDVAALKNLRKLDLKENEITELPDCFFDLSGLVELDLSVNKIKKLPKGIGNLVELKILKIASNWKNQIDLANLYSELPSLKKLKILHLCNNHLTDTLASEIKELISLTELDIDNYKIGDYP